MCLFICGLCCVWVSLYVIGVVYGSVYLWLYICCYIVSTYKNCQQFQVTQYFLQFVNYLCADDVWIWITCVQMMFGFGLFVYT